MKVARIIVPRTQPGALLIGRGGEGSAGSSGTLLPVSGELPRVWQDYPVDVARAIEEHAELFNRSVRSNDFGPFVATFAEDAVMRFTNAPAGPLSGRDAIACAYATQPPDDTMSIRSVTEIDPSTALARFDWDAGGGGTMVVRWRDGLVSVLEITFD